MPPLLFISIAPQNKMVPHERADVRLTIILKKHRA